MNYELIDNFLDPKDLKAIQDLFLGMDIAWNCVNGAVVPKASMNSKLKKNKLKIYPVESVKQTFDILF